MNVVRICDFLRAPLLADPVLPYAGVRPARKVDPEIQDREATLPLLLAHPWREQALPNRYDTIVSQGVTEQFALITICELDQLEPLRNLLFRTLLGAVLPDYVHETVYVSGETLDLDASVIWWRDIFQTQRERRQQT